MTPLRAAYAARRGDLRAGRKRVALAFFCGGGGTTRTGGTLYKGYANSEVFATMDETPDRTRGRKQIDGLPRKITMRLKPPAGRNTFRGFFQDLWPSSWRLNRGRYLAEGRESPAPSGNTFTSFASFPNKRNLATAESSKFTIFSRKS